MMNTSGELVVVRIIAPNPGPMTGTGTNSFIVGDDTGCIVIDPGVTDADHLDALLTASYVLGGMTAVVVTHGHPDHVSGALELATIAEVPLLAYDNTQSGVPTATKLVADGDAITAGQQSLQILTTPGHRFDHICLWHAATGILFAGDLVAGSGSVVIIPPEGDMRDYLESLARVQTLPLQRIWPGHGEAIDQPHELLTHYIQHRLDREAQVLAALTATPQTVKQLVPTVYADTPPAMYDWAGLSLLAHLLKLEHEGRATRSSGTDRTEYWHG